MSFTVSHEAFFEPSNKPYCVCLLLSKTKIWQNLSCSALVSMYQLLKGCLFVVVTGQHTRVFSILQIFCVCQKSSLKRWQALLYAPHRATVLLPVQQNAQLWLCSSSQRNHRSQSESNPTDTHWRSSWRRYRQMLMQTRIRLWPYFLKISPGTGGGRTAIVIIY